VSHNHLDDNDLALLRARNFCHVSTLRPDRTILTVVVWVDTDGEHVVLNAAKGRAWAKNLFRNGTATLTIQNLENPYEYVTIAGHLAEATHDGARAHIDAMERKYRGNDVYPLPEGQKRILFRITPDVVHRYPRT
jgi:PPOX class probable F420-dependent enzyme